MCSGLWAEITDTIPNSRAPSMKCLYTMKCKLFASWCRQRNLGPVHCLVGSILEFLQNHFLADPATLKFYVVACCPWEVFLLDVTLWFLVSCMG